MQTFGQGSWQAELTAVKRKFALSNPPWTHPEDLLGQLLAAFQAHSIPVGITEIHRHHIGRLNQVSQFKF